jgi:signal peptidase II
MKFTKQGLFFVLISITIILLDQISKFIINLTKPNLGNLFAIRYVKNTGAAFGIFLGNSLILGLFSLVVAVIIIWYYKKIPKHKWVQLFTALFLGGTIGNAIDRIARGYVIDFIKLPFWPAFNIADSAVTIGAIGIIIYIFISDMRKDKVKK